ncbi:hypothetical protein AAVH_23072 [Aphelenchoides avenae]|nr:hypothetical protein AAVH_23072 [Aphelenchus avenae]
MPKSSKDYPAYVVNRFPTYGFIPYFYRNNRILARIGYIGTSYIEFYQFVANTVITANRFTVMVLPSSCQRWWSGRTLFATIAATMLVPVPIVSFTFTTPVNFVLYKNRDGVHVELEEKWWKIPHWAPIASLSLAISTSALTLLMDIIIVVSIQIHIRKHSLVTSIRKNDLRLTLCTLVTFVAQALMAYYYYYDGDGFLEDEVVSHTFYISVSAMLSLSGSISLFLLRFVYWCYD